MESNTPVSGLSLEEKTALLKALMERRLGREPDLRPLSLGQQGLWLLYRRSPGDASYNVISTQIIDGVVDAALLREAFQQVLDRHEMLRSTFTEVDGVPYYRTCAVQAEVELVDCASGGRDEVSARIAAIASTPIDLEAGPVSRMYVISPVGNSVMIVLLFHHIVMDAWSMEIVGRELLQGYHAALQGRLQKAPASLSFSDFVRHEQALLSSERGTRLREYWLRQLGTELPVLNEPLDFPRTRLPRIGEACTVVIPAGLAARVYEYGRSAGATPFVVLLTAYALLLSRYARQQEIVIGCPVALRNNPAYASLVAYLINMIGVRADLSGDVSFSDLVARVKEAVEAGMAHSEYPFPRLIKDLEHSPDSLTTPVFQVVFNLLKRAPAAGTNTQEDFVAATTCEILQGTGQFDLVLELTDRGNRFDGHLKYDARLYRRETAVRFARNYAAFLERLVQRPAEKVSTFSAMTLEEEAEVTALWCGRPRVMAASPNDSLTALFERQCSESPDAIALVDGGIGMTYSELNRRAGQLAGYLGQFCGPEELVGICAEPSADMIIAILGILKAGCAYIGLSAENPAEQMGALAPEDRISLAIVPRRFLERFAGIGARLLSLDDLPPQESVAAVYDRRRPGTDQLACALFTSGTSAVPRGVMVEHGNILALLRGYEKVAPPAYPRAGMSVSPFTSAASLWEIFGMLCFGGTLHIAPRAARYDPRVFADFVQSAGVSYAWIPPGLIKDVADWFCSDSGKVPLRRILMGAEPLPRKVLARLREHSGQACITYGYGSTETTFMATLYNLTSAHEPQCTAPIGSPLEGCTVHIVDEHLRPVPVGATGEMLIGGAGVSRGDLHGKAGQRCYRSGDLARWLPDGNIEFVGRMDNQFDVPGVRMSSGDLSAVLEEHPQVAGCHVALVKDKSKNRGNRPAALAATVDLVAFVEPADKTAPVRELVRSLRERALQFLPRSFTAGQIVIVSEIPRNSHGKVDGRKLDAILAAAPPIERAAAAPQHTDLDRRLLSIFESVLKRPGISTTDDFFDLGGSSLLALRVRFLIEQELGVNVPVAALFDAGTVEDLAAVVARLTPSAPGPSIPRIAREQYRR